MKKRNLLLGIYLPIVFVLTGVAVAFRTVAAMTSLNPVTGYYTDKTFLTAASWIAVAAVIFGASYLIFGDKKLKLVASFDTPATYIPSAVVAVALLFMSAGMIRDAIGSMGGYITADTLRANALPLITAALALLAIAGFFLTSFSDKREDLVRAAFGIATVVFILAYEAMLYFDGSMPKNAPDRIVDLLAYVSASVFFLHEIRLSLGRDVWIAYIAFGMTGAALCAYSSIPALIVYFADGGIISNSIYETVFTFALFIFMTCRVLITTVLAEDKDTPLVKIIKLSEEHRHTSDENSEDISSGKDSEDVANYTFDLSAGGGENKGEDR